MLKKFVPLALVVLVFLNPSQAKMSSVEPAPASRRSHQLNSQMRTKSVLALAVPKHQRKFVAFGNIQEDESDDIPGPDELDLQVLYRRPKIVDDKKVLDNDQDLSDYVLIRLAVARARAMAVYRQNKTISVPT